MYDRRECLYLENTPIYVFGEVWYNDIWVQRRQPGMFYDSMIKRDESFNNDILVAAVPAPFRRTFHECEMRADKIGANLPFPRITRNVAKEDEDGIAGTELVFLAFDPCGPFVEWTIWGSGGSGSSHDCLRVRRWAVSKVISRCSAGTDV